ncbi:MAG: NAD-dependent epimerase/dehydratase family protein [Candidatus Kapabacteria bacterium]|nr:NAD-dependent epimerase/dehydratase family protein [Candidatus Kapabacteria bacterium]
MTNKIKVIITGASGMVGEGVMNECLFNENIEEVLVIGRRHCGTKHPKLKEILHQDFSDISEINKLLIGYDACFYCLGITSLNISEQDYFNITYNLTLHFAETLHRSNPLMTFCYVSGAGTDGHEKGKLMWMRIKGKTENDLLKLGFKAAYMFRPAMIEPGKGLKNTQKLYKYTSWTLPLLKRLFPKYFITLNEIGQAMINSVIYGFDKKVLEVADIKMLSGK